MQFSNLFRGHPDVYGEYTIERRNGRKMQGKAYTRQKPLTESLFTRHLKGQTGLGVVPIKPGNLCHWGAIDIDDYDLNIEVLANRVKDIPVVVCRTKSGGAHLYLFLKEPKPAVDLKRVLSKITFTLGYPDSEVFPKQDTIGEDDLGNWINLPYFDSEKTVRYAIKDGKALTLEEFEEYAEEQTVADLDTVKIELPQAFNDGPPCLQYLSVAKIGAGQKDIGLFNFAVYCKQKYGDDWETNLEECNRDFVDPPAKSATLVKVIKPHKKKNYFYTCSQSPLIQFCDKTVCLTREFGIGAGGSVFLQGASLTKINSDPPIWYLHIDGQRVEFSTKQLINQMDFRRVCFETIHKIPPLMKNQTWDTILQEKLDTMEVVEAPADAGPAGQFYYLLKVFCTEIAMARTKEDLLRKQPWLNQGRIYFQSNALLNFLENYKFRGQSTAKIYSWVRGLEGQTHSKTIRGKTVRLWSIPEYQDKQTEEFSVPSIEDEF
jgi:hypothetical protein